MTATAPVGGLMTAAQKGGEGRERERPLSDLERDKFEDMLRCLTVGQGLRLEGMNARGSGMRVLARSSGLRAQGP